MRGDTDAGLRTLSELAEAVSRALEEAGDYPGAPNERVRERPDVRTIRYYGTLGLMDKPARMRGRTALYGRRHLLQLVAIKRLQAEGRSLAEIQARLAGQPDTVLETIARVPAGLRGSEHESPQPRSQSRPRPEGVRRTFWKARPAQANSVSDRSRPHPLTAVCLASGVTLLIESGRSLESGDLDVLADAARPLVEAILSLRLLPVTHEPDSPQEDSTDDDQDRHLPAPD